MNIERIIEYCIPGIYALVNEQDRKVFVSYSQCISESVVRNVYQMKSHTHKSKEMSNDLNKLSFVFHENVSDPELMRLICTDLMSKYKEKGYSLYINKTPLKYTLKWNVNGNGVMVYLVSQRGKRLIVGVFKTKENAEIFMTEAYPNKDSITQIVYDKGPTTLAYYTKRKWELPS